MDINTLKRRQSCFSTFRGRYASRSLRRHISRFHARSRAARSLKISELVSAPLELAGSDMGDVGAKDGVVDGFELNDLPAVAVLRVGREFLPPVSAGEMSSLLPSSSKAEFSSVDALGFAGLFDGNPPLPSPSLSDLLDDFPDLGAISGNSLLASLDLDPSESPGALMPIFSATDMLATAVDSSNHVTTADFGENETMTTGKSKWQGNISDSSPASP